MPNRFYLLPISLLCCAVILQVAALPLSYWLADEFDTARQFSEMGIQAMWVRLSEWSPRPLSEFILYVYMSAVNYLGSPFVAEFTGLLWLIAAGAVGFGVVACPRGTRTLAGLTAFTTLIVPSFGPASSEPYFWAQAALAYVPTFAALVLVVLAVLYLDADRTRTWLWISALLILATLSSEVGMMVALCVGPVLLVSSGGKKAKLVCGIAVLSVAVGVVSALLSGRVSAGQEVFGDPAVAGNVAASLAGAARTFFLEAVALFPNSRDGSVPGLGAIVIALVGVFAYGASVDGRRGFPAVVLVGFGLALVAAAFGSLFSAYYQFGMVCCDRHGVFRYFASLLAVVVLATAFASFVAPSVVVRRLSPFSLAGALAIVAWDGVPLVLRDIERMDEIVDARVANWNSGQADGASMEWIVVEPGSAVTGNSSGFQIGEYSQEDAVGTPSYVLRYFGKERLTIVAPSP